MDYINSDFDIGVYWKTLNENGITKERLLSYDRAIHSEPNFRNDQKDGLLRDLGNYMRTLKVGFLIISTLSFAFYSLVTSKFHAFRIHVVFCSYSLWYCKYSL